MKKWWISFFICIMLLPSTIWAKSVDMNAFNLLTDDKIVTYIEKADATPDSYVQCAEGIYFPYQIVSVLRSIEMFIKVGVPIILIIMGMLDFGKVVIGKPDEAMKKTQKAFSARLISAVLVFFVMSIVEMILPIINSGNTVINCSKCVILDDENCQYMDITYPKTESTPTPSFTPKPTSTATPSPTPTESPIPEEDTNNTTNEEVDPNITR